MVKFFRIVANSSELDTSLTNRINSWLEANHAVALHTSMLETSQGYVVVSVTYEKH